ncbi:MAG: antitermination regulator, partial [Clostridia bacterium]|nr:antitermination regulator [Clostridia bacterium]
MDLKEQVFSVLVISASEKFNNSIAEFIPKSRFTPIIIADNVSAAKRVLVDNSFDVVIINSPLPDENGIDLAIDLCADTNTGVLLFSRADIYEIVLDKVMPYGILTISKPASSKLVLQSVNILCSVRQKLKRIEKKTVSIEEKMKE